MDTNTVGDLFQLVEDSLEEAKRAYTELAKERADKVRLEKVASDKTPSQELVEDTVRLLVTHDYLDESLQEKFASELIQNPSSIFKLANRLIEISALPNREGRGIPKTASSVASQEAGDTSAWLRVLHEGA